MRIQGMLVAIFIYAQALFVCWVIIDLIKNLIIDDFREDVRWYRSQNRCRYCDARLDPEFADLEWSMVEQRHRRDTLRHA